MSDNAKPYVVFWIVWDDDIENMFLHSAQRYETVSYGLTVGFSPTVDATISRERTLRYYTWIIFIIAYPYQKTLKKKEYKHNRHITFKSTWVS